MEKSTGAKATTAERLFGARSRSNSTGEDGANVDGQSHEEVKVLGEVIVPHILPPSGELLSDTLSSDNEQFQDAEPFAPRDPSKSPLPIESRSVTMGMCKSFIDDIIERVESIQTEAPPSCDSQPITEQDPPPITIEGPEPMGDEESRSTWMQLSALIDEPLITVLSRPSTPASHIGESESATEYLKMGDLSQDDSKFGLEIHTDFTEGKTEVLESDGCMEKYLLLLKEEISEANQFDSLRTEENNQSESKEKENKADQTQIEKKHAENEKNTEEDAMGNKIDSKVETEQVEINSDEAKEDKQITEDDKIKLKTDGARDETKADDNQSNAGEEDGKETQSGERKGIQSREIDEMQALEKEAYEEKIQCKNKDVKTEEQIEKENKCKGKEMVDVEGVQCERTEKMRDGEDQEKMQDLGGEDNKMDDTVKLERDIEGNNQVGSEEVKCDSEENSQSKHEEMNENEHEEAGQCGMTAVIEKEKEQSENTEADEDTKEDQFNETETVELKNRSESTQEIEDKCSEQEIQGEGKVQSESQEIKTGVPEKHDEQRVEEAAKDDIENKERDRETQDVHPQGIDMIGKEVEGQAGVQENETAQDEGIATSLKETDDCDIKASVDIANESETMMDDKEGDRETLASETSDVCDENVKHDGKQSGQSELTNVGQPQSGGLDSQPLTCCESPHSDSVQSGDESAQEISVNKSEVATHGEPDMGLSEASLHPELDKSKSPVADCVETTETIDQEEKSFAGVDPASSQDIELVQTLDAEQPLLNLEGPEGPAVCSSDGDGSSASSSCVGKSSIGPGDVDKSAEKSDLVKSQGNSEKHTELTTRETLQNDGTSVMGTDSQSGGSVTQPLVPSGGKPMGFGRGQLLLSKLANKEKFTPVGK